MCKRVLVLALLPGCVLCSGGGGHSAAPPPPPPAGASTPTPKNNLCEKYKNVSAAQWSEPVMWCLGRLCRSKEAETASCLSKMAEAPADYEPCETQQCDCVGGMQWTGLPEQNGGGCAAPPFLAALVNTSGGYYCPSNLAGATLAGDKCLVTDCECGECKKKAGTEYGCGCKAVPRNTHAGKSSCGSDYAKCVGAKNSEAIEKAGEPCLDLALCILTEYNFTEYELKCRAGDVAEHTNCSSRELAGICTPEKLYRASFDAAERVVNASAPTDPSPAMMYPCEECEWGCHDFIMGELRQTNLTNYGGEHGGRATYVHGKLHGATGTECCLPMPESVFDQDTCELKTRSDGSKYCELAVTCPCVRHVHEHSLPYNIIVLTAMIAIGNMCRAFAHLPLLAFLPYTVQVFGLGVLWGFLCKTAGGTVYDNFARLGDIDPHLLFYIFLPLLIFESAFATEYHVFKKVVWHCLFLAGPGLIMCSFLTAMVAKIFFTEYGWSMISCLLFGCVLSATDPVAVVALLKELGAAPTISALIEGESLLNDGTAIVFFGIFKESVPTGEMQLSMGEVLIELVKVAGGGPLVGLTLAFITKCSLKAVFNDPSIEITLTLVCAYGTFFIAEAYFHVSGVLGLVVAGMYLAYHCHVITPEVEHSLHHFWEIIVYMANTMIFAIAGLVISQKAFDNLEGFDFAYLLITYVSVNIIRGVGLACLFIPMNKLGKYQLDVRNAALCTWGGLRGAVGLALAVMILGDRAILCEHDTLGSKFLFHVAGIVVFTLCINGVTTGKVVHALGLDAVSMSKKRAMQRTFRDVMQTSADKQLMLQRKREYRDCNWQVVRDRCRDRIVDLHNAPNGGPSETLEAPPLDEDACEHYYRCFATAVQHEYKAGTMLSSSLRLLLAYLADVEDKAAQGEWTMIRADVLKGNFQMTWRQKMFGGTDGRLLHGFDTGIGFLNAHVYTLRNIDTLCHRPQAASVVKDHCKKQITATVNLLDEIAAHYPEISCSVKSRNASRTVLNSMRNKITQMRRDGKLIGSEAAILTGMVEANMKMLGKMPRKIKGEDHERVLTQFCPWYTADPGIRTSMSKAWSVEVVGKGDKVVDKARDGRGIWVCLSGVMRVQIGHATENFGPGYSAGILGCISGQAGKFSDVYAETECTVAHFETSAIQSLMRTSPALNGAMWDEASRLAARCILAVLNQFRDWGHVKTATFCETGFRSKVTDSEDKVFDLPEGHISILVVGQWKDCLMGRECGEGPCMLPKTMQSAIFWQQPVLFTIPNPLSVTEQALHNWSKISRAIFIAQTIAALHTHQAGKEAVNMILQGRFREIVKAQMDQEAAGTVSTRAQVVPGMGPKAVPPGASGHYKARPLQAQPEHLMHMAMAAKEEEQRKERQAREEGAVRASRALSHPLQAPSLQPQQSRDSSAPLRRPSGMPLQPQPSSQSRAWRHSAPPEQLRGSSAQLMQQQPRGSPAGSPHGSPGGSMPEATPWFSQSPRGAAAHRGASEASSQPRGSPAGRGNGQAGAVAPGGRRRQRSKGQQEEEMGDTVWL